MRLQKIILFLYRWGMLLFLALMIFGIIPFGNTTIFILLGSTIAVLICYTGYVPYYYFFLKSPVIVNNRNLPMPKITLAPESKTLELTRPQQLGWVISLTIVTLILFFLFIQLLTATLIKHAF